MNFSQRLSAFFHDFSGLFSKKGRVILNDAYGRLLKAGGRLVRSEYFPIVSIIVVSTVLNFLLVFNGSSYKSYLTSDMHGYWSRAEQIYQGDEMSPDTWVSNAPFYSRVIAAVFTWMNFLHLNDYFLECLLSLNILMSIFGTYGLYGIGRHIFKKNRPAWLLAGAYAFSYPNLYFNTFLLGEPFAVPLIIFSIWLMYHYLNSYKIYIAGLILAFAVGVRPSNGLLGLPFALYIAFAGLSLKKATFKEWVSRLLPRFMRTAVFSLAFFAVIFGIVAENYRISRGELRGMTAHTGYNFFLGQVQAHKIISSYDGITYIFVPSSVAGHPEYGTVTTHIPIYKSKEFFEEGKKVLMANPGLWWDHVTKYRNLLFDNLFPAVPSVWGFNQLFDPFRYILLYMMLFSGLLYITFKENDIAAADPLFFMGIFSLCSASLFFFTVTHQYFLNFSYSVYVLFAIAAVSVCRHFFKYRKLIATYTLTLIVLVAAYYIYKPLHILWMDKNVKVVIEQNSGPISNFEEPKDIKSTETIDVNNVQFFESEGLEHGTLGAFDYQDMFYMTATTKMEVLRSGTYRFSIYSDDGYQLYVNDEMIMGHNGLKTMDQFQTYQEKFLEAGIYTLRIDYFENFVFSGLVGLYRQIDPGKPLAYPYEYDTKRGKGSLIGDDDEFTRFHHPDQ